MKRAGTPNETSAKKADRAVLMIDPFPTPSSFDPDISDEKVKEQLWLRKVIFSLFPVLKDQARFKAIDLAVLRMRKSTVGSSLPHRGGSTSSAMAELTE